MAGHGGNDPFIPVKKLSKGVPDRARCQNKSGPFLLTFYGTFHTAGSEIGLILSAGGAQKEADLRPCRMESSIKGQGFLGHLARFIPGRFSSANRRSRSLCLLWKRRQAGPRGDQACRLGGRAMRQRHGARRCLPDVQQLPTLGPQRRDGAAIGHAQHRQPGNPHSHTALRAGFKRP